MRFLLVFLLLCVNIVYGQVENRIPQYNFTQRLSVGRTGNNDSSAYLQLGPSSGANRGLANPRLNNVSSLLGNPIPGLQIFDESRKRLRYYDGTRWITVSDSTASGVLTVQSIDERDAIDTSVRYEGLISYVKDSTKYYSLVGGIDNENWQEFQSGGGDVALDSLRTPTYVAIRKNTNDTIKLLPATEELAGVVDPRDQFTLNRIQVRRNVSDLRNAYRLDSNAVYELPYGRGRFRYSPTSTADDDSAMVVAPASGTGRFIRILEQRITPEMFGAAGDNATDDSPAFNKMFRYIESGRANIYEVALGSGRYLLNDTVFLPKTITSVNTLAVLRITGNAATLRKTNTGIMLYRIPPNQSAAENWIGAYRIVMDGVEFWGNRTDGQKAMVASCFYGAVIKNSRFENFDTAAVFPFWLNGKLENVFFQGNKTDNLIGCSGVGYWSGASTANSAFNAVEIDKCRFYNYTGSFSSIKLLAADQIVVRGVISEGNNPLYNFYYDYQGSTNVNTNTFEDIWIESVGGVHSQNTNFYIRGAGTIHLKKIQRIYPNRLFHVASTSAANMVLDVSDIPYMSNQPTSSDSLTFFSKDGVNTGNRIYRFSNMPHGVSSITNPSNWDGGTAGAPIIIDGLSPDGAGRVARFISSYYQLHHSGNVVYSRRDSTSTFRGVYVNAPPGTYEISSLLGVLNVSTDATTTRSMPTSMLGGIKPGFLMYGSVDNTGTNQLIAHANNSTTIDRAPMYRTVRALGTLQSPATVANNTYLRLDRAEGFDGTSAVVGARIRYQVSGTVSTGIVPTLIGFQTMNASGSIIDRFRINANGSLDILTAPATGANTDSILTRTSAGLLRQVAWSSFISNPLTTQGDIVYQGASNSSRLAIGTAGQVLKVNTGGTAPEWSTINIVTSSSSTPTGGNDGDMHLDTSTGKWYKKTSGSWGEVYTPPSGGGGGGVSGSGFAGTYD